MATNDELFNLIKERQGTDDVFGSVSPLDSSFDPVELGSQFLNGFIGGFTTIHTGDDPGNTYEGMARNFGHLLGFVGVVPGIGSLGSMGTKAVARTFGLAAKQFGKSSVRQAVGGKVAGAGFKGARAASDFVAGAKFTSVPFLASQVIVGNIGKAASKSATINASKYFGKNTIGADLLHGAANLGVASAASTWQDGTDAMMGAFLSGSVFGAAFRGIGNAIPNLPGQAQSPPSLTKIFTGQNDPNTARFLARTVSGSIFQGMPSTFYGEPVELQIYQYLLGAYFGGHEMGRYQRGALDVIRKTHEAYGGTTGASRLLFNPAKNLDGRDGLPIFKDLPVQVQEELVLSAEHSLGRYMNNVENQILKVLDMDLATGPEVIWHKAAAKAMAQKAEELTKEGMSENEVKREMGELFGANELLGDNIARDGGVDLLLSHEGKNLTTKNATDQELFSAIKELTVQMANLKKTADKNPRAIESESFNQQIINTGNALRGAQEESVLRKADQEIGNAIMDELSLEKGSSEAGSPETRIINEAKYQEILRDSRETFEALADHDVPTNLEQPLSKISREISTLTGVNRQEVSLDLIKTMGKALDKVAKDPESKTDAFDEFVRDTEVKYRMKIGTRKKREPVVADKAPKVTSNVSRKGGYASKGKGTPAGDGKDHAMRDVADSSIVELASDKPSSTKTTHDKLGDLREDTKVIMLARNGSLKGKKLREETVQDIKDAIEYFGDGVEFVVGDMPGVDEPFIKLLDKLGAKYTVYHSGKKPRIKVNVTKKPKKGAKAREDVTEDRQVERSDAWRDLKRTWENSYGKRKVTQLLYADGDVVVRSDIDLGKRTVRAERTSYLEEHLTRMYKESGLEEGIEYNAILEVIHDWDMKSESLKSFDLFERDVDAYEVFSALTDGGESTSRMMLSGTKDKKTMAIGAFVVRDPLVAAERIVDLLDQMDALRKKYPEQWEARYGNHNPRDLMIMNRETHVSRLKEDMGSGEKAGEMYDMDYASRLALLEGFFGKSYIEMLEANLNGTGQYLDSAVEYNKRVPIFNNNEARLDRKVFENYGVTDLGEKGLKGTLVNSVPVSQDSSVDGIPWPKRNIVSDLESGKIRRGVKHDAHMDGIITLRQDIYDAIAEFGGWPIGTSGQKGYIVDFDTDHGLFLGKPQYARADSKENALLVSRGEHFVMYDNAIKQAGSRKKYDLLTNKNGEYRFTDKDGKRVEPEIFELAPDSFTNNTSTGSSPKKEFGRQNLPVQLGKNLNIFQNGKEAIQSYLGLIKEATQGDPLVNEAFKMALKETDPVKAEEMLKDLDIEDIGIHQINEIMKVERVDSPAYSKIAADIIGVSRDDPMDIITTDTSQQATRQMEDFAHGKTSAWQIINSGARLTPALLETDLAVRPLWDSIYKSYVLRRTLSPKMKHSAQVIGRQYNHEMMAKFPEFKRGEFYLDSDAGKLFTIKAKGEVYTLDVFWKKFQKAGGWEKAPAWMQDAMEVLGVRVPQDSMSGGRTLRFMGFTGEQGTRGMFHPDDMFYLGGMDIDIDKVFLFQDLPQEIFEAYRSNQRMFEKGDAFLPMSPFQSEMAVLSKPGSVKSHPVNMLDHANLFSVGKAAYKGNALLGPGLNAANRAKVYQQMMAKSQKRYYDSVYESKSFDEENRNITYNAEAEEVVIRRYFKRDKGKTIDQAKTSIVNTAADAPKFEEVLLTGKEVGEYMFSKIIQEESSHFLIRNKKTGALRSGNQLKKQWIAKTASARLPNEIAVMSRIDRMLKGRDPETGEPMSYEKLIIALNKELGELPHDVANTEYQAAKILIGEHSDLSKARFETFNPGEPTFLGTKVKDLTKSFDKLMKTDTGELIAKLVGRKKIRIGNSQKERNAKKTIDDLRKLIEADNKTMEAAIAQEDTASAAAISKRINKRIRKINSINKTINKQPGELPVQDLFDMTFTMSLYKESLRALGLSEEKLLKMKKREVTKLMKPMMEIANVISEFQYHYTRQVKLGFQKQNYDSDYAARNTSIIKQELANYINLEVPPHLRRWTEMMAMSSLKPQETELRSNKAYKEAVAVFNSAKNQRQRDLAQAGVDQAKRDWWSTNYTRFWANMDIVRPSVVKEVFDTYSEIAGASKTEALDAQASDQFMRQKFGFSENLDTLVPGVTTVNMAAKMEDLHDNTVRRFKILSKAEDPNDPELLDLGNRLVAVMMKHPGSIRQQEALFGGITSMTTTENVGSGLVGMTKPELRRYVEMMEKINSRRAVDIHDQMVDTDAKFKWLYHFWNVDKFNDRHLNFDAKLQYGEKPVVTSDGKIEMREVGTYLSTIGRVHSIAGTMVEFTSNMKNSAFQQFSRKFQYLESTGKDRDNIVAIAVGLREKSIGNEVEIAAGAKAEKDLAALSRTGVKYVISRGEGRAPEVLLPEQMVERFNKDFTDFIDVFYKRWVGKPIGTDKGHHPLGLTEADEATIVWRDKGKFDVDLDATLGRLSDAVLKGHKPPELSLNGVYLLARRHMIDNIEVDVPPLTLREFNVLESFLRDRQEGGRFDPGATTLRNEPPDASGKFFDPAVFGTQVYKDWAAGKLPGMPKPMQDIFKKAQRGSTKMRLKDIEDRDVAKALEERIVTNADPRLAEKLSFRPVKQFTPERYWPRNGWPRSVQKAIKREAMEKLRQDGNSERQIIREEMVLERALAMDRAGDESGGMTQDLFDLFFLDRYSTDKILEVGGLDYRAGHVVERDKRGTIDGYDRGLSAAERYMSQIIKHNHDVLMGLMNSREIGNFEKSGVAGSNTQSWARFMKIFNRDVLGYPTLFPKAWMEDPNLKLNASPYAYFTDEYWTAKAKKIGVRFGFEGSYTMGEKRYVAHKLAMFSKLEGQYELMTLLARTKTGFANIFGGSENSWAWNGLDSMRKARDLDFLQSILGKPGEGRITRKEVEELVSRHGAIESFVTDEFQFSPLWNPSRDGGFIKEIKELIVKNPFGEYREEMLNIAEKHGIKDRMLHAGSFFMRKSERILRRDAWLASYIQARKVLKMGDATEVAPDHPWLVQMANRGVTASQFLYNNANRPAFARSSAGKIFSRFQIWGWKSVKLRREIYLEAKKHGYEQGTMEFERLKRIVMADMFIVGLAKLFPFSMFESSLPPPVSWAVEMADWAYGDKEQKESAFFGTTPLKIITPPGARPLEDVFRLMVNDDWDRFFDYHLYTYLPFGPLARDIGKTIQSPMTFSERLTGFPLTQFHQLATSKEFKKDIPVPNLPGITN